MITVGVTTEIYVAVSSHSTDKWTDYDWAFAYILAWNTNFDQIVASRHLSRKLSPYPNNDMKMCRWINIAITKNGADYIRLSVYLKMLITNRKRSEKLRKYNRLPIFFWQFSRSVSTKEIGPLTLLLQNVGSLTNVYKLCLDFFLVWEKHNMLGDIYLRHMCGYF